LERVPKNKATKQDDSVSTTGVKRAVSPSANGGNESSKKAKVDEATTENAQETSGEPAPEKPIHVGEVDIDLPAPKGELKQGRSDPNFKEDAFFFISPEDPELKSCM
jgi:hypothetical protein